MQTPHEIKQFIQQTLGCSCPDDVFDHIEHARNTDPDRAWDRRFRVGGRLLIYIVDADASADLPNTIGKSLEQGLTERNRDGFNRFRLVLYSADPRAIKGPAERAFDRCANDDDRVHLHVLDHGSRFAKENNRA